MNIQEINNAVNSACGKYYVKPIFSPKQNYAVYGVANEKFYIDEVKERLTKIGASKFRLVKNEFGFAIICFAI